MAVLKLKKDGFDVARQPVDRALFEEWLRGPGTMVRGDTRKGLTCRWFFGSLRAKGILRRAARRLFAPGGDFANALEEELNDFPDFIRKMSNIIRRRGVVQLQSYDSQRGIVIVPRGLVCNDFARHLQNELCDDRSVAGFPGLARMVIAAIAKEAEDMFFAAVLRGRRPVDSTGRGVLLDADPDYRWRINGTDGHYVFGHTAEDEDLNDRRARKRFESRMEEIHQAQQIYLLRLDGHERAALAGSFQR